MVHVCQQGASLDRCGISLYAAHESMKSGDDDVRCDCVFVFLKVLIPKSLLSLILSLRLHLSFPNPLF